MTLYVQGRRLELVHCDQVEPTIFSLFLANSLQVHQGDARGCDLGTGSGVLAIALAQLGMETVTAIDHSELACEITEENARRNGVADNLQVVHGELAELELSGFDLAVCNPPTMPDAGDTPGFTSGGDDPLGVLRIVAAKLESWLLPGGRAQVALSSLVAPEALDVFERAGFAGAPEASLPAPFRPFYAKAYDSSEVDSFLADGRMLRSGASDLPTLTEIITVYRLSR